MTVTTKTFPLHTVRYLLDALKPAGTAYAFVRLTNENGTWFDHPVALQKMALVNRLRAIKSPDAKTVTFYVRTDTEQYHSRAVFIGRDPEKGE